MPTIEQLEQLLDREPDDVFLNFGLSMALAATGRLDEALERFDRTPEARETLETGIAVARRVGNEHATGEMSEYLAMLEE
ncbi:MAG: hypothetical protein O7J95_19650 [Planctomycetota bacterium]|nr:hypothetical protein [Planctomycetota bacterium]